MSVTTLANLLHHRVEQSPSDVALRTKVDGTWTDRTWSALGGRADAIAAGLLSAPGVTLGDNDVVGILGQTSENWIACDFAGLSLGLQTVPIYASLHAEEVGYAHVDTGIKVVFVDDADQLEKVRTMRKGFTFFETEYAADQVVLQHVVVIDPTGASEGDDWESLADLEARGRAELDGLREEMTRRREAATPDQTATYTYTSGTTGPPKAVIQTSANHLSTVSAIESTNVLTDSMRDAGLFLFLPLAHSFGRLLQFSAPYLNLPLVLSSVPTLAQDVAETRPGQFTAAPRVFEKMKSKIDTTLESAPAVRKNLALWALGVGERTIPYRSRGKDLPLMLKLQHGLADRLVLSTLRERIGLDRAEALISGSAPLAAEVQNFFLAMGLELLEGYGLTETCPALTVNLPGDFRVGTVGKALPHVELKIADDKEILARGPNVTQGYLNRPDSNSEAFDDEGWFHTGDEGSLDGDGFLSITGRKKELIKTSGGKYVAPAKIEGAIKLLPMIQEAILIGDTYNYVTALISVDPDDLADFASSKGIPAEDDHPEVAKAIDAHIEKVNEDLASFETVKYWTLVPPLTIDDGLLTASLKVKRNVVHERYSDEIDSMYSGKSK